MKRIALKIDVDTYRGTLSGVPNLSSLLQRYAAGATFFFSLGPDCSGRDCGPESLARYYDWRTRLSGRLLRSKGIGSRCVETMQQTAQSGFDIGIHAWDRASWERKIGNAENGWIEHEMQQSRLSFEEIFSRPALAHAAAGWRMNRHALRLTQRLGFRYASDCRGDHPFLPVVDGELIDCPQLPTTLPTLDEILTLEPYWSAEQAAERILQLSQTIIGDHVFTLRAELEGLPYLDAMEHLLREWQAYGYELISMQDMYSQLDVETLPRHTIRVMEAPGRKGLRLSQGPRFLQD